MESNKQKTTSSFNISSSSSDSETQQLIVINKSSPSRPPPAATTTTTTNLLSQRVWSKDDEVVILQGIIDYRESKNVNPLTDLDSFIDFIKKDLDLEVFTDLQLREKIRKLKKKFMNKATNKKKINDVHEQRVYLLSQKIWGGIVEAEEEQVRRKRRRSTTVVAEEEEAVKGPRSGVDDYIFNGCYKKIEELGVKLFESGKSVQGEESWKKLKIKELEVHQMMLNVKRRELEVQQMMLDVKNEQAKLVLETAAIHGL